MIIIHIKIIDIEITWLLQAPNASAFIPKIDSACSWKQVIHVVPV